MHPLRSYVRPRGPVRVRGDPGGVRTIFPVVRTFLAHVRAFCHCVPPNSAVVRTILTT